MLTKEDKKAITDAFKMIDVKKLEVDHQDPRLVKWFRFGSFVGIDIATKVVNELPEKKSVSKKIKVT